MTKSAERGGAQAHRALPTGSPLGRPRAPVALRCGDRGCPRPSACFPDRKCSPVGRCVFPSVPPFPAFPPVSSLPQPPNLSPLAVSSLSDLCLKVKAHFASGPSSATPGKLPRHSLTGGPREPQATGLWDQGWAPASRPLRAPAGQKPRFGGDQRGIRPPLIRTHVLRSPRQNSECAGEGVGAEGRLEGFREAAWWGLGRLAGSRL